MEIHKLTTFFKWSTIINVGLFLVSALVPYLALLMIGRNDSPANPGAA